MAIDHGHPTHTGQCDHAHIYLAQPKPVIPQLFGLDSLSSPRPPSSRSSPGPTSIYQYLTARLFAAPSALSILGLSLHGLPLSGLPPSCSLPPLLKPRSVLPHFGSLVRPLAALPHSLSPTFIPPFLTSACPYPEVPPKFPSVRAFSLSSSLSAMRCVRYFLPPLLWNHECKLCRLDRKSVV